MNDHGVDPLILKAWLSARSIARGLPEPVAEHGGSRVDTNSDAEIRRWVFPAMGAGLQELALSISEPRHLLKLCGEADDLRSVLPHGWELHAPSYFMQAGHEPIVRPLAEGYSIEVARTGMVIEARILSDAGALAASGYAAETEDVFIYDRIVTAPEHRRKGLGQAVMMALRATKAQRANPELLVATEEGWALYSTLGWRTISPYSTASIEDALSSAITSPRPGGGAASNPKPVGSRARPE